MKRILVLLLLCAFTLSCTVGAADAADVNCDGRVTIADALLCVHELLNGAFVKIPDLSGDGRGSLADILCILRLCVTEIKAFASLGGTGSEEDPYRINSESDLILLREQVLRYEETAELYFVQTKDITLEAKNWVPIGTVGIPFAGIYDGGGHKIRGLHIETDESFQGMFGFITGTVENLTVYGEVTVHYTGTHSHSFAGGIVGAMNNGATVRNCESYVTVEGDSYVGGVVGAVLYTDDYVTDAFSVIENCSFHGTLNADDRSAINEDAMYFGGITGRAYGAVKSCINYGDINVVGEKTSYVGGIAGYGYTPYKGHSPTEEQLPALTMENCENRGKVSGGSRIGGIVAQTSLPVKNCINNGDVSGRQYVGGIAGICGTSATYTEGQTEIIYCTNNAKITISGSEGGGIAGYSYSPIENCENTGEITGAADTHRIGGIVGFSRADITACTNQKAAKITGHQAIGGIVGYHNQANATVSDCDNFATVAVTTADDSAYHIGGIVGMLGSTNRAIGCENTGDVTGGGSTHTAGTGGIVGSLHSGSVIEACANRGDVTAIMRVGGVAGHGKMSKGSHIRDCENYGTVTATAASGAAHLGGILGSATSGNITDCTNHGKVQASEGVSSASATVGSKNDVTVVTNIK